MKFSGFLFVSCLFLSTLGSGCTRKIMIDDSSLHTLAREHLLKHGYRFVSDWEGYQTDEWTELSWLPADDQIVNKGLIHAVVETWVEEGQKKVVAVRIEVENEVEGWQNFRSYTFFRNGLKREFREFHKVRVGVDSQSGEQITNGPYIYKRYINFNLDGSKQSESHGCDKIPNAWHVPFASGEDVPCSYIPKSKIPYADHPCDFPFVVQKKLHPCESGHGNTDIGDENSEF